jgi:hypothetical protein
MSSERNSFYSRTPKSSGIEEVKPQKLAYVGTERRSRLRRTQGDRRDEIRFDLSRPDRRVLEGRRAEDLRPKFW